MGKRKRGRPKKKAAERRSKQLGVRVRPELFDDVQRGAETLGISFAQEVVRRLEAPGADPAERVENALQLALPHVIEHVERLTGQIWFKNRFATDVLAYALFNVVRFFRDDDEAPTIPETLSLLRDLPRDPALREAQRQALSATTTPEGWGGTVAEEAMADLLVGHPRLDDALKVAGKTLAGIMPKQDREDIIRRRTKT